MQSLKRDPSSDALPPALIYAAALTFGVLAALALEIYLTGAGFDPANLWENFLSSGTRDLRTAGPWWGIVALAFVVGGITAAALSRLPPPWHRYRLLRWVAAGVILLLLEDITHSGCRAPGRGGRCERGGSLDCAVRRSADGLAGSLCRRAALTGGELSLQSQIVLGPRHTRFSCGERDETIVRRLEP